jgi:hypothetical protein
LKIQAELQESSVHNRLWMLKYPARAGAIGWASQQRF